jgi:acyl carrier protein
LQGDIEVPIMAVIEGMEFMKAEKIRAMILEVIHEIVPDEDLSNLKPDVRIRDQIEMDSMDFLDIIMELRKRYGITVPEDDYIKLSTLDGSVAYLEPLMKNI